MQKPKQPEKRDKIAPYILPADFEDVYEDLSEELDPNMMEKANFRSELDYDGYSSIEDYDNTVLGLNTDEADISDQELNFEDRPEFRSEEESLIDPQDNEAILDRPSTPSLKRKRPRPTSL